MKKYLLSAKAGSAIATALLLFSVPVSTQTAGTNPAPFEVPSYRRAFFDAARIYGKAGCGDMNLAEMTATHALRSGVPANVVAAIVAVESSCNPLAISGKGAVGLTQVNVKVQATAYDFSRINLFDPDANMDTGTKIMASMIRTYGKAWISHYDGIGDEADAYAAKVTALAGK